MKILSRWTSLLLILSASHCWAGDENPPFPGQTEAPRFAEPQDPFNEDLPLEVPLAPSDPFAPPAGEEVVPVPAPWIEPAPPAGELPFALEEAAHLPSEYTEYQGTVVDNFPQYCTPPWHDCYADGSWAGTEAGPCQCHSQRLRWWQKACPWNWGRDDEHEPRCQNCIQASLRAMSRMHPPGMLQNAVMGIQVSNGNAAQLMLHHYDFVQDKAELSVRGQRELRRMASVLPTSAYLIKVEATPYRPALAWVRHAAVVRELGTMLPGIDLSARVIISEPYTRGLDGVDAIPIQAGLLQLQSGGTGGPSAGGASVGFPGAQPGAR